MTTVPSTKVPSDSDKPESATSLPSLRPVSAEDVQEAINSNKTNTKDLSLPIYINGVLPDPSPENPLVIQTSSLTQLSIVVINEQLVQLQDSEGFSVSVSATDSQGQLARVNARGSIVVERGNFISIAGTGFLPNSDVVAWLFSQPRRLGVIRTLANGSFEQSFKVDSEVLPGEHTQQVNGLTESGEIRSINLALEVVDKAPRAEANTTRPPGNVSPSESEDSDTIWLLGLIAASLLLTAGVGLFARSRGLRDH